MQKALISMKSLKNDGTAMIAVVWESVQHIKTRRNTSYVWREVGDVSGVLIHSMSD